MFIFFVLNNTNFRKLQIDNFIPLKRVIAGACLAFLIECRIK